MLLYAAVMSLATVHQFQQFLHFCNHKIFVHLATINAATSSKACYYLVSHSNKHSMLVMLLNSCYTRLLCIRINVSIPTCTFHSTAQCPWNDNNKKQEAQL